MKTNLNALGCTLIALTLLSGCGFSSITKKPLPPELQQVYYQTEHPYGQFEVTFKRKLKARGIVLLTAPSKTSPIIQVTPNYSYSTTNPASSIQGRIYNLAYTNTITISNFKQQPLLPAETVTVSRTLTLGPNEVFENTPEIEINKNEMVHELSIKTLNILTARRTCVALQKLDR